MKSIPAKNNALSCCFSDKKYKDLAHDVYIFLTKSENKTNTH
jgi:hypothetical protein